MGDVLGYVPGPGRDGIGEKAFGIPPSEKTHGDGYHNPFIVISAVDGILKNRGVGDAVPGGKGYPFNKLGKLKL